MKIEINHSHEFTSISKNTKTYALPRLFNKYLSSPNFRYKYDIMIVNWQFGINMINTLYKDKG